MSGLHDAGTYTLATCMCTLALVLLLICLAQARPDSAGDAPLPGPGLTYGGIPYGSVSGKVAEYFKRQVPSIPHARNLAGFAPAAVNGISIVKQWM